MRRLAAPAMTALLLAGCASVPRDRPQVAQVQPATLGLSTGAAVVAPDWWTAFGDPQLDGLIAMGLAGNPSLEASLARVRAADAQVEAQHAGLLPQVSGSGQVDRARIGGKFFPPPIGGGDSNIALATASLRWDLDLFGRQRAAVRRAAASADAARLDVAASRLTLSVAIAQTYVSLARATKLINVADGFVQTRRNAVGYAQSRVKNQLGSQFDIQQAATLLAQAQQAHTLAVQQRDVLVHALAA